MLNAKLKWEISRDQTQRARFEWATNRAANVCLTNAKSHLKCHRRVAGKRRRNKKKTREWNGNRLKLGLLMRAKWLYLHSLCEIRSISKSRRDWNTNWHWNLSTSSSSSNIHFEALTALFLSSPLLSLCLSFIIFLSALFTSFATLHRPVDI